MKPFSKILFLVLLMAHSPIAGAQQNLVANGSFEEHIYCSAAIDNNCVDWHSARYSPDYYNTCNSDPPASVPNNWLGHYPAYDGNAYIGIYTYGSFDTVREYVRGNLISPLIIGQRYYVSYKVILGIDGQYFIVCANNKFGALFTNYTDLSVPLPIPNHAHIYSDSIITNTQNWTMVSGSFIADSAYQYIMLGVFFDNSLTDTLIVGNNESSEYYSAYYFIDDVRISTDSTCVFSNSACPIIQLPSFVMPSAFSPNGDNTNDLYLPALANTNIEVFRIYNRWGQKIFEVSGANAGWDGKYKGEPQPIDIYAYYIEVRGTNTGKTESRTGSFALLR